MLTTIQMNTPAYYEYAPPYFDEWLGNAVSREAQGIDKELTAMNDAKERSQALFGAKAAAISQLNQLAEECKEEDWDGDGASATDEQAVFFTENFVRVLPDSIPLPEFAPEPDGSISLDWIQDRNHIFSISIGPSNRLAYAWMDGTNRGHAVENFGGQRIPPRVLNGILSIIS